jgi:hypothetical protein
MISGTLGARDPRDIGNEIFQRYRKIRNIRNRKGSKDIEKSEILGTEVVPEMSGHQGY